MAAQVAPSVAEGVGGDTTRFLLAELLYRAERWREAHDLAVPLGARHASNPIVLAPEGRTAARVGDREGALRVAAMLSRMSGTMLEGAHTYGRAKIAALLGDRAEALRLLHAAVADGLPFSPDGGDAFLGHADMDLESLIDDPGVRSLLRPRG